MKLELDEISGDYIIRIPEEIVYDLEWKEDESVELDVQSTRAGDHILVVRQK